MIGTHGSALEASSPTSTMRPCFFIVPATGTPCGVEDFARKMTAALQKIEPSGKYELFPVSGRWGDLPRTLRQMARADRLAFSLPLVAWKRTILLPWALVLCAFFMRQKIFVYMHEWSSLHPLRRLVIIPFAVLSKSIIFLSPFIRDQYTSDFWVGWMRRKCCLAMHAPTVRLPDSRRITDIVRRVEVLRNRNRIVIGHFGSIYKGKGTDALLDVCAYLCEHGVETSVVFIGGMTKSLDGYEDVFLDKIKSLKLDNRVIVTGYIEDDEQLFAIFDRIHVFLYIFPEGLTARRSSVLASLQSGRPVVVSAPISSDEFSHHRGYTDLIESGALLLFPSSATTEDLARYITTAAAQPARTSTSVDYDTWWKEAAQSADAILGAHPPG